MRRKLITTVFFALPTLYVNQGHADLTIASSSRVEVPISLSGTGSGNQMGIHKLIFETYRGDSSFVDGYVDVQINTTGGSIIKKLPVCSLDEQICWNTPEAWTDVDIFDGLTVENPVHDKVTSIEGTGVLINTSGHDAVVYYSLDYKNESNTGTTASNYLAIGHTTIPAQTVCSVDINTPLDLGVLIPGQSATSIQLANNASGNGIVTFKPDNHDSSGGIIKNDGGDTLGYSITGTHSMMNWDAVNGQYRGDLSSDYAFQLEQVPLTVKPGEYRGIITATISCD